MSFLIGLARHLEATVPGVDFDEHGAEGNTFIATLPSGPDLAVGLFPSGGVPWIGHSAIAADEPTVQIRVRSIKHDPRPGLELAQGIYDGLIGFHGLIDAGGDHETNVRRTTTPQTGPASIGFDANHRHEAVLNFAFRILNPTPHRT